MNDRAHIEPCRDWQASVKYCTKLETRVPHTEPIIQGLIESQQGKRTDLHRMTEAAMEGSSMSELALLDPVCFVRHSRGLSVLRQAIFQPVSKERKCVLLWGETGSGKTRLAFDLFPALYSCFCIKSPWFDGYDNHAVVLLDECGPGMMHWNVLKKITDRYAMRVPIKGGNVAWNPDVVILTSNNHLAEWYSGVAGMNRQDYLAIERRLVCFQFPQQAAQARAYLMGESVDHPPSHDEEMVPIRNLTSTEELRGDWPFS